MRNKSLEMEVFSTVVVEISASVFTSLPYDDSGYKTHDETYSDDTTLSSLGCYSHETSELSTNYRAKFLEEKLKDLNVNVVVMSEKCMGTDAASSLKVCGGWNEICAVRIWLMNFIKTTENLQYISGTQQLDAHNKREVAATEHCAESLNKPRRSLRSRHTAKRRHNADMLSSTLASSKQIRTKQLKQNTVQMKHSAVLLTDITESKISSDKDESFVDHDITKAEAYTDGSVSATVALIDEHTTALAALQNNDASSSSELRLHLKEQEHKESEHRSTSVELKCDSCDYVARKQRNLSMHIARTHGDRLYICQTCDRRYAVAKDLNQHMKCHTEQYCCELCGRTLKSKYAVALHIARIHRGVMPRPVKRYLCNLCGKMCRNRTDYNIHRNKEHTGVRPFCCDLCNATFFSKSNLRAHRQVPFML